MLVLCSYIYVQPSFPSPISCPRVRKPHHLSGLLLQSDRCPDVICLHLRPPSVLLNCWGWCEEEKLQFHFSYMLNVLEVLISGSWFQLPWQSLHSNLPTLLLFFAQHHLSINICASFLLPRALMFRVQCHWTASQSLFFFSSPVSFGPCLARERLGAGVLRWVSHPFLGPHTLLLLALPGRFKSF